MREVYLWPDNVEAWQCWLDVQTQWRMGMSGRTGLDYAGVRAYLEVAEPEDAKGVFEGIRACEQAVMDVWAKQAGN